MSGMNVDWALKELDKFIEGSTAHRVPYGGNVIGSYVKTRASEDDLVRQAQVVERILDRVIPLWGQLPGGTDTGWERHREAAIRAKEELLREAEVRENLGDNAPQISAAALHPWVWSGAASLWQSGHFHSAVEDAAKKVNAETQNKVGRRDISETDLFKQAFSLDVAAHGKARLRRMTPDVSDTYKSLQRGAMALAEGIYAGIRNPLNHELADEELDEQVALEYLAALSVLARWVGDSTVERAGEDAV
jgi:hypothetical protein